MTISTTIIKNSYSGDASNDTFAYQFKISTTADMQVIIRSATGTETVKTLTTHYTVTNAGVASGALFQMTPISELRKIFEINFFSQIAFSQGIAKIMIRNKSGSIINLSSTAAFIADPGTLAYGSSKSAFARATQSMANELGIFNIRVNAIAPGVTKTDMSEQMSHEAIEKLINSSALKRAAEPKDIANVALFLASELSSFITGQVIRADGGIS